MAYIIVDQVRLATVLFFVVFMMGCGLLRSENESVLVRVTNHTGIPLAEVIIDYSSTGDDQVRFEDVPSGATTEFQHVDNAFEHYTVRVGTGKREMKFAVEAPVPAPLAPGHYTYVLTIDDAGKLRVNEIIRNRPEKTLRD